MSTRHRLRFSVRCLLLTASCFLAACANVPPSTDARAVALTTNIPVTLTLWHAPSDASAALFQTLINDFHQAYPTITIRVEVKASDGDLLRQGLAAIALNQMPDVLIADDRTLAEFARRGALAPLDARLADEKQGLREDERADFFPGFLDAGKFPELKNQTFALPFDQRAAVLYYNADLLRAAKVETPRTWEQFSNVARATTRGNARGWVMSPRARVFYAMLFSRGGNVLNDAQMLAQFNDDAGLKTLQLIVALTKGGAAYLADSDEQARADFAHGRAALWLGDTDDLARLADAMARANSNAQWGVTNIPQDNPARAFTALSGSQIALARAPEERIRAAWVLARWLTAPEQSARWSRATLRVPVRRSALTLLAPNLPPLFLRLRDGFGDALPTARAAPTVKDAALIDAAIVELWTSVANGAEPNAALKNASARVNRILGNIP
ncbi:MAG: extracellular solute-binding protein [Chloroflexi bacterium]|nr:extracellular solute-binding protein [Chloroflexota bacterium]